MLHTGYHTFYARYHPDIISYHIIELIRGWARRPKQLFRVAEWSTYRGSATMGMQRFGRETGLKQAYARPGGGNGCSAGN
jgi:hypothetical protein